MAFSIRQTEVPQTMLTSQDGQTLVTVGLLEQEVIVFQAGKRFVGNIQRDLVFRRSC